MAVKLIKKNTLIHRVNEGQRKDINFENHEWTGQMLWNGKFSSITIVLGNCENNSDFRGFTLFYFYWKFDGYLRL